MYSVTTEQCSHSAIDISLGHLNQNHHHHTMIYQYQGLSTMWGLSSKSHSFIHSCADSREILDSIANLRKHSEHFHSSLEQSNGHCFQEHCGNSCRKQSNWQQLWRMKCETSIVLGGVQDNRSIKSLRAENISGPSMWLLSCSWLCISAYNIYIICQHMSTHALPSFWDFWETNQSLEWASEKYLFAQTHKDIETKAERMVCALLRMSHVTIPPGA